MPGNDKVGTKAYLWMNVVHVYYRDRFNALESSSYVEMIAVVRRTLVSQSDATWS